MRNHFAEEQANYWQAVAEKRYAIAREWAESWRDHKAAAWAQKEAAAAFEMAIRYRLIAIDCRAMELAHAAA